MEVTATLRNVKFASRKGRLVADLVRTRSCGDALNILRECPKSAARPIKKLLESALANAQVLNDQKSAGIDLDNLYVKKIAVDRGSHSWRISPRAQGRAYWVRKMSSHLTVVLDER